MQHPKSLPKNIREYIIFLYFYYNNNYGLFSFPIFYRYIDTQSNKKLNASTAFQLLVRPGSYTINSGSKDSDEQFQSVKWATKEAGATVIMALLIHLDGF